MSELPKLNSLFTPPAVQKVVLGQPNDYVGVYCEGSHITIIIRAPRQITYRRVELWHPIFDCAIPSEMQAVGGGYFAVWFTGIPSQRGRYGDCVREVRVTGITRSKQGRPDEYFT